MKGKVSATGWAILAVAIALGLVSADLGVRWVRAGALPRAAPPPSMDPAFKVGDEAPDFSLPNRDGSRHTLSALVRSDTLLCFICGCARCRALQTYIALLEKRMAAKPPKVISIASSAPEAEAAYVRDTGLKQTILYENARGQVNRTYRGHPCPRVFQLDAGRRVRYISPSGTDDAAVTRIAQDVARLLGFRQPGEGGAADPRPVAPAIPSVTIKPAARFPFARPGFTAPDTATAPRKLPPRDPNLPPYLQGTGR
jgi:peroxiredoxin